MRTTFVPNDRTAASPEEPPDDIKIGVVLFDNPMSASDGWACEAGGEPFRVSSALQLPSDTLFISNLAYEAFASVGSRVHNLRGNDFFRSALPQIASDIGWRVDGAFATESIRDLADIARRVVQMAFSAYGWKSVSADLREKHLSVAIRSSMPKELQAPKHIQVALASANQVYSSPSRPWQPPDPDSIVVGLRMNRFEGNRRLLSTPAPDGAWTLVPQSTAESMALDQWLDPAVPSLVNATLDVSDADPAMVVLAAYGCTPSRKQVLRAWMTQVELAWISGIAHVQVQKGYVARGAKQIPAEFRLPGVFEADAVYASLVSVGVVAECHCAGLMATEWIRDPGGKGGASYPTTMGCWMRAMDRALLFQIARDIEARGFVVTGYGSGAVQVRLPRSRLQDLHAFALSKGIPHPAFDRLYREFGGGRG